MLDSIVFIGMVLSYHIVNHCVGLANNFYNSMLRSFVPCRFIFVVFNPIILYSLKSSELTWAMKLLDILGVVIKGSDQFRILKSFLWVFTFFSLYIILLLFLNLFIIIIAKTFPAIIVVFEFDVL